VCGAELKAFQGLWVKPSSSAQTQPKGTTCVSVFLEGDAYIGASIFNVVNGKQHKQAGFNPPKGGYASEQGNEWDSLTNSRQIFPENQGNISPSPAVSKRKAQNILLPCELLK